MAFRKSHTLRRRLIFPILAIVIVQALLYGVVFLRMNVMEKMDNSSYSMLMQHTSSRALYLENQMVHRWSNLDEGRSLVLQDIAGSLSAMGRTTADLQQDPLLAQQVVAEAAQSIIHLLRTNAVTGAFLLLDAPGLAQDDAGTSRAGLYIRDLDPAAYSENNSDLQLERAMPALSRSLNLPLGSYWSSVFTFESPDAPENYFFFRPLQAAHENPKEGATALGYWSPIFSPSGGKQRVITYSQPLIAADGTVIGVIGIDLAEDYLLSQINPAELGLGNLASYSIGRTADQNAQAQFSPMLSSGTYFNSSRAEDSFALKPKSFDGIFESNWKDMQGSRVLFCPIPLSIYNHTSVYNEDSWVLSSVVSQAQLLNFSTEIRIATYLSILLSLACALVALYVIGRMIITPIRRLADDLVQSDPAAPLTLPKLDIVEIDSLSDAIETLSASVAASASKFSEIIRLTGLPVGVFEYIKGSPTAFCSRTMCQLLGWDEACATDMHLPIGEFDRRMHALERSRKEGDSLYQLSAPNGDSRWLRIVRMQQEHSFVGSISDVTREVREKHKIEYERDYDTLSRLYNRRAFERIVGQIFEHPENLQHAALVMWDLDNLKYLNDTYGHDCGDQYILAFASLLSNDAPPQQCVVSRRSGDEFNVFFYGFESRALLRESIEALYQRISASSLLLPSGERYRMRASGGIAHYPDDALTLGELMRYSDFAMYSVKHSVKGNLEEFNLTQYEQNSVLLHGHDALDRLIDQKLVRFALQPILDVHTVGIYGYEMLMRSQVAELRSVSDILRLARSYSKLRQIEHLTLFEGMAAFKRFDCEGLLAPNAKVFLNSVASQHLSPEDQKIFIDRYRDYFSRLVLEITENDPYDTEITQMKIDTVRGLGGQIALDDYGSGYNSDAILLFLSPDYIKVDLSIIRDIHKDPNRQSVFNYLVSYAKPRGIRVLAEGVETQAELEYVVAHGVDLLQGFFIAKPALDPPPIMPEILDIVRHARTLKN